MKSALTIAALIASVGLFGCESNKKSDPSLKEGARDVGHAVGSAAREVGQGAKKVGKTVGEAAKEGGRAFKDAVKSDE
jgi:uncharacterized lipoprotein NlpE involved in copper resistance